MTVQLLDRRGPIPGATASLTVPARDAARVAFGPPSATPEADAREFHGPLTIRLTDPGRPGVALDTEVAVGLRPATGVVRVVAARYDPPGTLPDGRSRLSFRLRALGPVADAPCPVELVLDAGRIPGLLSRGEGTFRGTLRAEGDEVTLFAEGGRARRAGRGGGSRHADGRQRPPRPRVPDAVRPPGEGDDPDPGPRAGGPDPGCRPDRRGEDPTGHVRGRRAAPAQQADAGTGAVRRRGRCRPVRGRPAGGAGREPGRGPPQPARARRRARLRSDGARPRRPLRLRVDPGPEGAPGPTGRRPRARAGGGRAPRDDRRPGAGDGPLRPAAVRAEGGLGPSSRRSARCRSRGSARSSSI